MSCQATTTTSSPIIPRPRHRRKSGGTLCAYTALSSALGTLENRCRTSSCLPTMNHQDSSTGSQIHEFRRVRLPYAECASWPTSHQGQGRDKSSRKVSDTILALRSSSRGSSIDPELLPIGPRSMPSPDGSFD